MKHTLSFKVFPTLLPAMMMVSALTVTPAAADTRQGPSLPDLRVARGTNDIDEAWLIKPTTRYQHFVLGARYEAGGLAVRLRNGRTVTLDLADDQVFEDRQPRLADLDGDGRDEIVVVRSSLSRGAAIVVIGVEGERLRIKAETPPTGRPNTWRNPAAIADLDGDGRLDIAEVQMPHVLGRLRVWTLRNGRLVKIARVEGVSNHQLGSPRLGLSAVADFDRDGVMDLALPALDRRAVRFLTFKGGKPREIARRELPSPAVADFAVRQRAGRTEIGVGVEGGKVMWVAP